MSIIWNQNIIHECPFQILKQLNLNVSENIWSSDQERLVLQTTRKVKQCGITFYETVEGFHIIPGELGITLPKNDRELKTIHHLILSDMDYRELINIKRTSKLNLKINENMCKTVQMIIHVYKKQHNKFITINDAAGNEITIYNNDGLILLAECINIQNITIQTNMKACHTQPEVEFQLLNKKYELSLFDDSIIAYNKEVRIDCRKRKITLIGNNK